MKKSLLHSASFLFIFLLFSTTAFSQSKEEKNKISISGSYGMAGSFFVRSFQEVLPFPSGNYRAFLKKRFIGNAQNFTIGYRLKDNYEIKAGINSQHFTRRVKATDTLQSVIIRLDNTIHHRDYMYFTSLHKAFERKKYFLSTGLGLYYLRDQDETIEYGPGIPNYYSNYESNYRNSKAEEGGIFAEFAYEYKFQPKVNIGVKAQFYFTASAGTAESVTLLPYIRISF
jgi:hypothetical protein